MDEAKLAEDFWRAVQYTEVDRQTLSAFLHHTAALVRGGLVKYFETCGLKGGWAAEEIRTRWSVLPPVRTETEDYPALVHWIAAVTRGEIAEYFETCGLKGGWAAEEIRTRWWPNLPAQVFVGPDAARDARRYLNNLRDASYRQMAGRAARDLSAAPRASGTEPTPWLDDAADAAELEGLKRSQSDGKEVHAAAALQRLGR